MGCSNCGHESLSGANFLCGMRLGPRPELPGLRRRNPDGSQLLSGVRGRVPIVRIGPVPSPNRAPVGVGNGELPVGNRRLPYPPKHLADKILQSKSALEGERKQVTVLFADVKGSMELAEGKRQPPFSTPMGGTRFRD